MNWLDFVILALGGVIALAGWRMGGIRAGVTAAGILAGIALAGHLHGRVEPLFSRFIDRDDEAEMAAFIAIVVLVFVASAAAGAIASGLARRLMLGWADKLLGMGLGIVIALAIGSSVLSAVQSYPVFGLDDTVDGSALGSFLADNFDVVLRGTKFIPSDLGT